MMLCESPPFIVETGDKVYELQGFVQYLDIDAEEYPNATQREDWPQLRWFEGHILSGVPKGLRPGDSFRIDCPVLSGRFIVLTSWGKIKSDGVIEIHAVQE